MKEWLGSKGNRYLVILIVAVVAIGLLVISVIGTLNRMDVEGLYPADVLSREEEIHEGYVQQSAISYGCMFSSLKFACDMPMGTEIDGERATCEYKDMNFVAMVAEPDMKQMCEETFPQMFYMPIVGRETKARKEVYEEGYLYDKPAKFAAYTVSTQVSTKEKVAYTMCYEITSKNSQKVLYLYASVEEKERISEAYGVLCQIADSVVEIEDVETWVEEHTTKGEVDENGREVYTNAYEVPDHYEHKVIVEGEEGPFDIYIGLENDRELTEGVLLVEWENFLYVPYRLDLYDENGNVCSMNKEYSVAGHYVYELGSTKGGSYALQGGTMNPLTGGKYYFLEMEQYENLYQAVNAIPHD